MTECNQTELPFGAHFSRPTEKSELRTHQGTEDEHPVPLLLDL
jgi:hypothetical protein